MHFHLPKPLHGWREFAGEVGIIVVGVLIALGAEQVVEGLHWRRSEQEAVKAMSKDAASEREALLDRYDQEGCIGQRLSDIGTLFARHDAGQPVQIAGAVGRPFYTSADAPAWDVAVADGSVAHLSFSERSRFANAFGTYRLYDRQMWEEKRAWQQLQMLNHLASFTPPDWSQARQAYDLATDFDSSFRVTLPLYLDRFKEFSGATVRRRSPLTSFQIALCRPLFGRRAS